MGNLFSYSGVIIGFIALVYAVFCTWNSRGSKDFFIFAGISIAFTGVLLREVLTWLK